LDINLGQGDGKTGYCPNAGIPQLREILAADVSASHGVPYAMGISRRGPITAGNPRFAAIQASRIFYDPKIMQISLLALKSPKI
jgi:hypothetical protein